MGLVEAFQNLRVQGSDKLATMAHHLDLNNMKKCNLENSKKMISLRLMRLVKKLMPFKFMIVVPEMMEKAIQI